MNKFHFKNYANNTKGNFLRNMSSTRVLRVGVSPWSKMDHKCLIRRSRGCDAGMELEILETIAIALNLTLKFRVSSVRGCGKFHNGTWTGLADMLLNNEIDIIGNLCDNDETRGKYFGLSVPVWQYPNAFLMKLPDMPVYFKPAAPFNTEVWRAIALCTLVWYGFVAFYLLCCLKMSCTRSVYKAATHVVNFTIGTDEEEPVEWFWLIWFCFVGCILMLYNNYIVRAVLFSYPLEKPFKTSLEFSEALAEGKYTLLDYRDPPDVEICYDNMCDNFKIAIQNRNYVFSENSTGFALLEKLVSNDKLVFMKGKTFLETYLSDYPNRDKLWLFEDDAVSQRSVFLWRKNDFPYEKEFNHVLWNLAEFKLTVRTRRLNTSGRKVRIGNTLVASVKENKSIKIGDFTGPAYVLLGGFFVSFLIFFVEKFFHVLKFIKTFLLNLTSN